MATTAIYIYSAGHPERQQAPCAPGTVRRNVDAGHLRRQLHLNCSAGGYQYYYTDALTSIDGSKWTQNGTLSATATGLTSAATNGGSLISKVAVPDGTAELPGERHADPPADRRNLFAFHARNQRCPIGTGRAGDLLRRRATKSNCQQRSLHRDPRYLQEYQWRRHRLG